MRTRIIMLKNAYGCDDGYTSRHYKEGEIYDVSLHLAKNFIHAKLAEHYSDEKAKQSHDNKALTNQDYDNKENKPNRRERR